MPVIALFVPEVSAGESMALLRMSRNAMQYRWRWEMQVSPPPLLPIVFYTFNSYNCGSLIINVAAMKKIGLLFVAFGLAVAANAQLRVDSLGRSEFGVIPRETMDLLPPATATVYGIPGRSALNLYMEGSSTAHFIPGNLFIQCVSGNTNEEVDDGLVPIAGRKETFKRVFYVDKSGMVYAEDGVIHSALNPGDRVIVSSNEVSRSSVQSPLSKLSGITGVSYTVEQPSGGASTMSADNASTQPRQRLGLLAEEVEAGVPEAVVTLDDGTKGISYSDLVVTLIDAVNELNAKVTMLEEQLAEACNAAPEARAVAGDVTMAEATTYVEQNAPNPFDSETVIRYGLADGVSDACLCIYDLQGKQVKRIDLADRQGQVVIAASELGAGMYIYSLIADGQEVDSHRMILTD